MKLPSSREAHLKAIVVNLEATNAVLPSPLYAYSMLPLVAIMAIFQATLDSLSVVSKGKAQVTEAGDYLAKRLATMVVLVDKSTPTVGSLLTPSQVAQEVGREGKAKPSYLTLPVD